MIVIGIDELVEQQHAVHLHPHTARIGQRKPAEGIVASHPVHIALFGQHHGKKFGPVGKAQITHPASFRQYDPLDLWRSAAHSHTEKPSATVGHEITQRLGIRTVCRRPGARRRRDESRTGKCTAKSRRFRRIDPVRGRVEELNPATAEPKQILRPVIVRNIGQLVLQIEQSVVPASAVAEVDRIIVRRHTLWRDGDTTDGFRQTSFVDKLRSVFKHGQRIDLFGRIGVALRIPDFVPDTGPVGRIVGIDAFRDDEIAQNFRIDDLFIVAVPRCGNHAVEPGQCHGSRECGEQNGDGAYDISVHGYRSPLLKRYDEYNSNGKDPAAITSRGSADEK